MINILAFDHIVLAVAAPAQSAAFYERVLGMTAVHAPSGKWSVQFGQSKINFQPHDHMPAIAQRTTRGSGNFCLITNTPIDDVVAHLNACQIEIVDGPDCKEGAVGTLLSVYFYDPDGNLVEVSNRL